MVWNGRKFSKGRQKRGVLCHYEGEIKKEENILCLATHLDLWTCEDCCWRHFATMQEVVPVISPVALEGHHCGSAETRNQHHCIKRMKVWSTSGYPAIGTSMCPSDLFMIFSSVTYITKHPEMCSFHYNIITNKINDQRGVEIFIHQIFWRHYIL